MSTIPMPIILGHEMMGCVARLGPGVTHDSAGQALAEGDRIVWTHASCGSCYLCTVAHQPTLCPRRRMYMFTNCEQPPYLLGGFAEYCYVLPTSGRIKVPDAVSSELASAASCALRTVIHGFDRLGRVEDCETVVVQGAGPLGLYAAAMALRAGAHQALQFLQHNRDRFPFEDMLSNRYRLDQINDALEAMRAFREVKPVVMP